MFHTSTTLACFPQINKQHLLYQPSTTQILTHIPLAGFVVIPGLITTFFSFVSSASLNSNSNRPTQADSVKAPDSRATPAPIYMTPAIFINAEGGDGEGTRNAAIQEAFTIRPAKLNVGKFISLACTSDHPLLQLLLSEKAIQYTSVPCFSELTAMVYGAAEDLVSELPIRRGKTAIRDSDCRLEDLNDMLLQTDLDHLILRELTDTLVKMERITNSVGCIRISSGVSTGPWTEFAPLLAPLDDRHVYLPALLPAFEWIRSHTGGIHMVGCPRTPTPHESEKWESTRTCASPILPFPVSLILPTYSGRKGLGWHLVLFPPQWQSWTNNCRSKSPILPIQSLLSLLLVAFAFVSSRQEDFQQQ